MCTLLLLAIRTKAYTTYNNHACSSQVVAKFHLNICTVEVVDTGRHLTHLYFPSKVVFIMVIIPFFPSLSDEAQWVWGLRLCNYLINTCTLKILLGQCFPKGQFYFSEYLAHIALDFVISQVQTNP